LNLLNVWSFLSKSAIKSFSIEGADKADKDILFISASAIPQLRISGQIFAKTPLSHLHRPVSLIVYSLNGDNCRMTIFTLMRFLPVFCLLLNIPNFSLADLNEATPRPSPIKEKASEKQLLPAAGERVFGIDFNTNSLPGAPTQSGFRGISGLQDGANGTSLSVTVNGIDITLSKTGTADFNFRGFNATTDSVMPGGPTSLSGVVADFIATTDGPITVTMKGLPAGDYLFRSWHLEPHTGPGLGFASGSSSTDPQWLAIEWNGTTQSTILTTALGEAGLDRTAISNDDIPSLECVLLVEAGKPVKVTWKGFLLSENISYVLINGFEICETNPKS